MRPTTLAILLCLATALSACAGAQKTSGSAPSEVVDLDPMLVRPGAGPDESIDVNDLFDRAYRAFGNRMYEDATRDYETIVRYFPKSRFYLPSLYNAGLAYEKLERWDQAARVYRTIVTEFPGKDDTTDAFYRLAVALEALQEHQSIVDLMTEVLLRPNINTFDRVEAHVRRANALLALADYNGAVDGFRNALIINDRAVPEEKLAPDAHFVVQSYFGIGRAHHHMVAAIPLVLPPERMGADLQKKAELFMTAQVNYIRALGRHHPQWSMAAGYMIGRLYEDFYRDIFTAEIPDDLTEQHLSLYFEELRKQLRPLMERAVQVYEKNLSLSKRIVRKDGNEWVAETEKHLGRLKAYLDDPVTQQRAERFVLNGRDFTLMWEPLGFAQDGVSVGLRAAQDATRSSEPQK